MRTKLALVAVLAALGFGGTATAAAIGVHDSVLAERKTQAKIAVETTAGMVQSFVNRQNHVIDTINAYQATIASAVEEQTATVGELSRSVAGASDATRGLAGIVGEVADEAVQTRQGVQTVQHSADDLTDLSQKLATLVGGFTTR